MQNEDQTNESDHVDKEDQKDMQKGGPRFPRFRSFTTDRFEYGKDCEERTSLAHLT